MSHALFDAIMDEKNLLIDEEVGALIGIKRNAVAQYRSGSVTIGPAIILRVYDATGWSIERIRELVADATTPRRARARTAKQVAASKRRRVVKQAKPAKPVKAAAPVAKPVPPAPADLPRVTITKTPKWVSRVHRVL